VSDGTEGKDGSPSRGASPLGLTIGAIAALVFVVGTLLSLLNADDSESPEETGERPRLAALIDRSQLVVEGTAGSVERLGDPSDAGVIATIAIERIVASTSAVPDEVTIYDMGFREGWSEGQTMLLFLSVEGTLPGDADFRVRERCILEEGALPCPYEVEAIERLAD
jgi:hypothetical protein